MLLPCSTVCAGCWCTLCCDWPSGLEKESLSVLADVLTDKALDLSSGDPHHTTFPRFGNQPGDRH